MKNEVFKYKNSLESISVRRISWDSETKNQLITSLTHIIDQYDLDWVIDINDKIKNLESVSLLFKDSNSGLDEDKVGNHIKIGGILTYRQSYNGEIHIIITYPKITNIVETVPNFKLIKIVNPKIIAGGTIRKNVVDFLNEMTNWENEISSNSIMTKS